MKEKNEWLSEFNEFASYESEQVPENLSSAVLSKVHKLLNPNAAFVFAKLLGIFLFTGFLSLAVCHQFGMNPFRTSFSMADVFMRFAGHEACMLFCGILFTGISLTAAGLFLSIEEVRAIKRTQWQQLIGLTIIALGLFTIAGAELVFSFTLLWAIGALIGGYFSIESNLWLKENLT